MPPERWWPAAAESRSSATARRWCRSPTPTPSASAGCSTSSPRTSAPCCRRCCPSATAAARSSSPAPRSSCPASSSTASRSRRRKKPTARTRSAAATSSRRSSTRCRSRWASTPRGWPTASTSSAAGPRRSASTSSWPAQLAESILVRPVDWVDEITRVHEAGARWILDLGPGDILTRLTAPVIRGLGVGIVPAATRGGQRNLFTVGAVPEVARAWSSYAPTVVRLPDGRVKLSTKFTRLTGRSPILLAGMTPTTVDAKIVAAAANAGHWAELAGGGQVTEEIFADRIERAVRTARARPHLPVQRAVPRPVPVEAAGRRQAAGAEGAPVRRGDRRRGGQRRHPGPGGRRRADRRAQRHRHQPRRVQARHRRADPLGHPHRHRGAHQAGDHAHRGRTRRWPPLLGRPRRPVAGDLLGVAVAAEHHRLRRRRHRHAGAGGRIPVRALGAGATASR